MRIQNLTANNIKKLSCNLTADMSLGIAGLSGSGKSTFCRTISEEATKRVVTLLPKSEYRFLFGDNIISNYTAQTISELPMVFYLGKAGFASNPRSTLGTHTGFFKEIRNKFAQTHGKAAEFFSFNHSIMWCEECKGRGSIAGHVCKSCGGSRYSDEISKYPLQLEGRLTDIRAINAMSVSQLLMHSKTLGISETGRNVLLNIDSLI